MQVSGTEVPTDYCLIQLCTLRWVLTGLESAYLAKGNTA